MLSNPKYDDDQSLSVRAAWLHYVGGLRQAEVAKHLGVTNVKAHRLITRANKDGIVKVTIDGEIAECVALELKILNKFGLDYCEVVPNLTKDGSSLRSVGVAGARFLTKEIQNGKNSIIGIGHGRTLSSCVHNMIKIESNGVQFVSLLGGLNRNYSANPHDVMHHLATKTTTNSYVMPVPFFANTPQDREVLLAQPGVLDIMKMAVASPLKFVGIGSAEKDAQLVSSGMVEEKDIKLVKEQGGVGEILGHFFTQDGDILDTQLTARTLSVELSGLMNCRIVAVAGGLTKTHAIVSALKSKLLSGLITNECTARALLKLA